MACHILKKFFLVLGTFVCLTNESIYRLPCRVGGDFDVFLSNLAVNGTPLGTFAETDRRKCVLHCLSHSSCQCLNHNKDTSVCETFSNSFQTAIENLVPKSGWTFIGATDETKTCSGGPNPCLNGGMCKESCNVQEYECICPNGIYGINCEDDLQSFLNKHCQTVTQQKTLARYGGKIYTNDTWSCYETSALTEDDIFWAGLGEPSSTDDSLVQIVDFHIKAEEYIVGSTNKSCSEECSNQHKSCNPSIQTLNSVYLFEKAGVSCQYEKEMTTGPSASYGRKEDPVYIPSLGFCYGFVRVPMKIDCEAKHPEKRRLCRCV